MVQASGGGAVLQMVGAQDVKRSKDWWHTIPTDGDAN